MKSAQSLYGVNQSLYLYMYNVDEVCNVGSLEVCPKIIRNIAPAMRVRVLYVHIASV